MGQVGLTRFHPHMERVNPTWPSMGAGSKILTHFKKGLNLSWTLLCEPMCWPDPLWRNPTHLLPLEWTFTGPWIRGVWIRKPRFDFFCNFGTLSLHGACCKHIYITCRVLFFFLCKKGRPLDFFGNLGLFFSFLFRFGNFTSDASSSGKENPSQSCEICSETEDPTRREDRSGSRLRCWSRRRD